VTTCTGFRRARPPLLGGLFAWAVLAIGGCAGGPPVGSTGPVPEPVTTGLVCTAESGSTAVSFPDEGLERAIRGALQVTNREPLTCAVLARVTRLHAPDAGIRDLSGIENLVRLGELHVYGNNRIRDVSPIAELPALTDLNLARNEIEDIAPLGRVRTLTSLDLYGNPVRDIAPIGLLTGLIRLRLSHVAELSRLEALSSLRMLTRLELAGNDITDLTPLAALTGLTRLSLSDSPHLRDLTPLTSLVNLEVLELGGTAVSDLAPLGALQRITTLSIDGTRVFDLGPLLGLAGLTRLDLRGNVQLTDIQPLLFHPTLGEGDGVRLEGTGVSCTDVAALQVRGVTVFTTCR
jgi:internalin A